MEQLILVFHVLGAIAIIALILIQQGKGADAGASFGGGASQTLFGSRGSGNALTRATAILATLFFATSFALAVVARDQAGGASDIGISADLFDDEVPQVSPVQPVDEIPSVEDNAAPSTGETPSVQTPNDTPANSTDEIPATEPAAPVTEQ
jgi:preprotein translocase subunit SecG